jgi:hypothetical protein
MPNQMIALQARSPQLPDPSRRTAQFVNMMNMTRQQEAAQRQAEQAQQAMTIEAAKEARAAELHGPALTKAQQDNILQALEIFREGVADIAEGDIAAAEAVRADLVARVQGWDKVLPPAASWDRNTRYGLMMKAEKEIDKTIATPVASLEVSVDGTPRSVTVGGLRPGQEGVYDIPETPAAAPRATPTAPQTNPMAAGATPRAADAEPGSLGLVIASALETGVMSKNDYDKMISIAQPQIRPKIAAWAQQNNIEIVPDAPGVTDNRMRGAAADFETSPMSYDGQTPQSQFAVFRGQPMQAQTAGLGGAPEMRQTLAQARTSTPLQMRNPNVSTAPAETPEQAGRRAFLTRETPEEVYAKEKAKAKAAKEAALEAGPKPLTSAQEQKLRATITKDYKTVNDSLDQMLNPVTGVVAAVNGVRKLSKSQKEWLVGKTNYLPSLTDAGQTADTRLGNLTGKVTQMGKVLASLGGAIGPMAVQEWNIVRGFIAELDPAKMSPKALEDQLDIIEAAALGAAERISDAYNNQYVEEFARYPGRFELKGPPKTPVTSRPKAESQLPRIKTDAQWNALEPGTLYIAPNGETKRKR